MAFDNTLLLDDFNRANQSLSGGGGSGLVWAGLDGAGGAARIVSNQAAGNAASSLTASRVGILYPADQQAWGTVAALPTTNGRYIRLYVRWSGASENGYFGQFEKNGSNLKFRLFKVISNSVTEIGTGVDVAVSAGERVGIDAEGPTIRMWHETGGTWAVQRSETDASVGDPGYTGIGFGDTVGRLDDFGGGPSSVESRTVSAGDQIGITAKNDVIRVWYRPSGGTWESARVETDSTYSADGYGAIGFGDTTGRLDDYSEGAFSIDMGSAGTVDDFNRANEDPVSQSGGWTALEGPGAGATAKVVSNQVAGTAAGSLSGSRRASTVGAADEQIFATIAALPGSDGRYFRLYLRWTGATQNGYMTQVQKAGSRMFFRVFRVDAGLAKELPLVFTAPPVETFMATFV